ncbi:MAG: AhpC/TSA family protein [Planctomycetota bacterium]|nr:AhpC/TSA family protein [Planctomycetota bacterium]
MRSIELTWCLAAALLTLHAWSEDGVAGKPEDAKGLAVGDRVPAVTVKQADGKEVNLAEAIKAKPALLIFYRGGWCPFCHRHLAALQEIAGELEKAGYQILAVSPETPEDLPKTAEKSKAGYTLLSDTSLAASKAFKLAFKMDDATIEKYKKYKFDLSAHHWILPAPAVYVVGTDGKIAFAHVNPDYKSRLDNAAILAAAKKPE